MFHARHIVFRDRIEYVANEEIVVGVEQMKVKPLAEFTIRKTVPSDRRQ
jgi:flagellar biogenesis protein FliO